MIKKLKLLIKKNLYTYYNCITNLLFFFRISTNKLKLSKTIKVRKVTISFECDNLYELRRWLLLSIDKNEPDTLNWIDNFKKKSIFFDVGANIGNYSLYASKKGHKVFSFEPETNSFAHLIMNVKLNNLNVSCFNFPIADRMKFNLFNINNGFSAGESDHQFGGVVSMNNCKFNPTLSYGMFAYSIDYLMLKKILPIPDYLKIDVDGIEEDVLKGCKNLFMLKKDISVMCEINNGKKFDKIINYFKKYNFILKKPLNDKNIGNFFFSKKN